MAEDVQIGNGKTAKIRSPWFVGIIGLLTVGIYLIFWWYFVNREMADYGRAKGTDELGTSPGLSVLAVTLGWLVVVPGVMTTINTFRRAQKTQSLAGESPVINGWIGLILFVIITPAYHAYVQSGLNSAWRRASLASTTASSESG